MNALEGFAHYMVTQFFLPRMCHVFYFPLLSNPSNLVRASSVKTSQPTPCPQSNRQQRQYRLTVLVGYEILSVAQYV